MKLKILTPKNSEKGSVELPEAFAEPVRTDLIKKAVDTVRANARQRYGADSRAGKKCSAELSRRRRKYRGSYGQGISRVPRKILSRSGNRLYWVGAFAPGTVGGRRAHAPKSSKIWSRLLNIKERRKAVRSAIAATVAKDLVEKRGHKIPSNYPFVMSDDFESLAKTKDVKQALLSLGLEDELSRSSKRTFRAGKSRLRGRKYRKRKGPLFVVSKDCPLIKSASNLAGVDVATVDKLNAELLAPGCVPGRMTLFTESALKSLGEKSVKSDSKRSGSDMSKPKKKDFPKKNKDKVARAKKREKRLKRVLARREKGSAEPAEQAAEEPEKNPEEDDVTQDTEIQKEDKKEVTDNKEDTKEQAPEERTEGSAEEKSGKADEKPAVEA